ncbi:MAG: DUF4132 domain-containing protein [Armatimonadetes bacterium]|nr:DUF4132 domain-containing protein [Armatimonadota bacterium]
MSHISQPRLVPPPGASEEIFGGKADLLCRVTDVWPSRFPRRAVAGLPPEAYYALPTTPRSSSLAQAASRLDRSCPGWPEHGAAALARAAGGATGENLRRLSALLAQRPLRDSTGLIRGLTASCDPDTRLWLLVALAGSDTAAVRSAVLAYVRDRVRDASAEPDTALWFAFLRSLMSGWLNYYDFQSCVAEGRVFAAFREKGTYPAAVARLKLDTRPNFSKWYRQAIYEIAHQPDVALSYGAGGWIRDFPGADYLWDALAALHSKPDSWWHLHLARWTSGTDAKSPGARERLKEAGPIVLCVLSLLRPDLLDAISQVLSADCHKEAVTWLKTASPNKPVDLRWIEARLRPWADSVGGSMITALGALCGVELPEDFPDSEHTALRRREFLRQLIPEFDRVMDNALCLHALRKEHLDIICRAASKGRSGAIRFLALWPEQSQESMPLLFRLTREGTKGARQASREALEILQTQCQINNLTDFETRLDLATAWSDGGLDGKPSRVWWDVCNYRVKLSVAVGRVVLHTYSGSRRLASIPKAVREHPEYEEIRRARAELSQSYRYFRRRFEVALVEATGWRGRDFATLLANPIVRSLISRLVLLVDGRPYMWRLDDPLVECDIPDEIAGARRVAVAHPVDLLRLGVLTEWQQRIIDVRISQPFKQVFRECYVLGDREQVSKSSHRFEGRALIARRAFALLRSRGYSPRSGEAVKDWPQHGLVAHLRWAARGEDAGRLLGTTDTTNSVTSGPAWFTDASGETILLGDVPPVMASETLRDADLLVSCAAQGDLGFTSEEALRLRAALVRYLTRALGLTTVYVSPDSRHALVEGRRAMYRVHLGSGSVFLEESRRHLDMGTITSERLRDLIAESIDTPTARILGLIGALTQDQEITDPHFLSQLPS